MNRLALRQAAPAPQQLGGGSAQQRKELLQDYIQTILHAIAADGREPDEWESRQLQSALGFLLPDWYTACVVACLLALEEPNVRVAWPPTNAPIPSLAELQAALDYVRLRPARGA